jgi:hypothetical protein
VSLCLFDLCFLEDAANLRLPQIENGCSNIGTHDTSRLDYGAGNLGGGDCHEDILASDNVSTAGGGRFEPGERGGMAADRLGGHRLMVPESFARGE